MKKNILKYIKLGVIPLVKLRHLLILCIGYSYLMISVSSADEMNNILSKNKNLIFDYEFRSNIVQSNILENSWINPIMVQYSKNISKQFTDRVVKTGSFSIGIDQPIFRSGGIYFAIKYAQALREENEASINLKKREMIGNAVKLLFEIKKLGLEQKKLALLIKNDKLDIRQKRESYSAGLIDSSFLDQAILKANQDEVRKLEIEISLLKLEQNFALLSDKDPKKLKLPNLKLISLEEYKNRNLELVRDQFRAKEKAYNAKMIWAKYMPSVSVQARYVDEGLNPLFARSGIEENYWMYGFTISMPLDINMFSNIEGGKVAHLKSEAELIERRYTIDKEYTLIKHKLKIIKKKIVLAQKDAKLYRRLYQITKNLAHAGEKTSLDTAMMYNSLQVKGVEQKIYKIDKQIVLIGLYTKIANAI